MKINNYRKVLPFFPILGIPLTMILHVFYGDTGIENVNIRIISGLLQSIFLATVILFFV